MTDSYLVDTNVVSELSKPLPSAQVLAWLEAVDVPNLSVITLGELTAGFHLLPHGRRRVDLEATTARYLQQPKIRLLPVTESIANRWGELSSRRRRVGRPLAIPDGLSAATALEHGLTLVTRNMKDFTGLGLVLFDPWQHESSRPGETRQ